MVSAWRHIPQAATLGDAINAYNKAKMIDPTGPAATAIEAIYEILNYRNTDMMNP